MREFKKVNELFELYRMMSGKKGITISDQMVILAIVVGIIGAGIVFILEEYSNTPTEGPTEDNNTTFSSSKYGFSFTYPSSWILENREGPSRMVVQVQENSTNGLSPKAQVQIAAGGLGYPPLDNLRNEIENSFKNDENIKIISDLKDITLQGSQGVEVSYRVTSPQGNMRVQMKILKREDSDYVIYSLVEENSYDEFESELTQIVGSFTFLEK